MFTKARLTLTGWYVLIIMAISIFFSIAEYRSSSAELERSFRRQVFRNTPFITPPVLPDFESSLVQEAERRIALELLLINLIILAGSSFAAYFLAGKTLKPIEIMVDEQKRFVADASHELRTPLTAMKTEIEVTLRDKKLDIKQAREQLNSNLEEVNKMQSLSNYLLSLSKYQDSKSHFEFTDTPILEIINDVAEKTRIVADKKHIGIIVEGENVTAQINPVSITELVNILLDNAVKYSHNDGKIIVKLRQENHLAVISVQDFGMGIKASDLPYIFNRFYRADSSRNKSHIDGYGLGLAIAKSITNLHNGEIQAESVVDTGSIFTVKLPLKMNRVNLRKISAIS